MNIRLDQTVAELKKQLTRVVQLSTNSMRLYYIDKCSAFGPEEMKYNTRVLHSYGIQDGDELMVVPKTKWAVCVWPLHWGETRIDRLVNGWILHSKLHFYWLIDQKKGFGTASFWDKESKMRNIFKHHCNRHPTAGKHSLEVCLVSLWTNLSSRKNKREEVLSQ